MNARTVVHIPHRTKITGLDSPHLRGEIQVLKYEIQTHCSEVYSLQRQVDFWKPLCQSC